MRSMTKILYESHHGRHNCGRWQLIIYLAWDIVIIDCNSYVCHGWTGTQCLVRCLVPALHTPSAISRAWIRAPGLSRVRQNNVNILTTTKRAVKHETTTGTVPPTLACVGEHTTRLHTVRHRFKPIKIPPTTHVELPERMV